MQPFIWVLLEPLYLVVLNFTILITAITLTILHALPRLPAYLMRLFGRPRTQHFRFLDLPPELRNMVYHHLCEDYWRAWRRKKSMLPDGFLYLNKQVYGEAMHVLYTDAIFSLRIFSKDDQNRGLLGGRGEALARIMERHWHLIIHMHTFHLHIYWCNDGWLDSSDGYTQSLNVRKLKKDIEMVCTTWLVKMPNLRTILIDFIGEYRHPYPWVPPLDVWVPRSPPRHRILGLLRPLKLVRRRKPGIVVLMPEGCPISTAQLAEQQGDITWCARLNQVQESVEDMNETMQDMIALRQGLMRADGAFEF